jgi:hypothetical protein
VADDEGSPGPSFADRTRTTLATWREWHPPGPVWVQALVAVAVGTLVTLGRRPGAVTGAALWAEDGRVFLVQALERGVGAVNDSYAGYLHVVPRLIAMGASWLPFGWTPTVYALGAAVVTSACCALVLSDRMAWLMPSWFARAGTFVLLLCLPRVDEIHATLTNSIWWCGIALLLLILCEDPTRPVGRVAELVAVIVLVLSGANGMLLAPFVVLRWWRTRSLHSGLVIAAWWASAGVQAWVLAHADRSLGDGLPNAFVAAHWGVERAFGPFVLGAPFIDEPAHLISGYPGLALAVIAVLGLVAAVVIITGQRPTTSILVFGVAAIGVAAGFRTLGPSARLLPARYTAVPAAALLIGIVSARPPQAVVAWAKVVLVSWIVLVRPLDYSLTPRASVDWGPVTRCVEADLVPRCVAPLNPPVAPGEAPWQVVIRSSTA